MRALAVVPDSAGNDALIDRALSVLESRMRVHGPLLTKPQAVRRADPLLALKVERRCGEALSTLIRNLR
jgi:hypothetical protein